MVIQEDALDFFIVGFAIHKEQRYCIKKKEPSVAETMASNYR